ncbi:MAG TPA: hypothetical protein VII38_02070 [Polyangia bacterium]
MKLLFAASLLLLAGCPQKPDCPIGFIGDPQKAPEAVVLWTDGVSGQFHELTDGQALPLEPPPQGGYVMYVGAKVRNVEGCGLQFSATMYDQMTGAQVGFDARSTDLTVGADGWGYPQSNNSNVSNVNGCPQVSTKDVQGVTYNLRMIVTDKRGRSVTIDHPIVPTCAASDPDEQQHCLCTCSKNYYPGKCPLHAPDDGGPDRD